MVMDMSYVTQPPPPEESLPLGMIVKSRDEERSRAGDYGVAIAGRLAVAIAGDHGYARTGEFGYALAGDRGIAISGEHGFSTVGVDGVAMSGEGGVLTMIGETKGGVRYAVSADIDSVHGPLPLAFYRLVGHRLVMVAPFESGDQERGD